MSDTIQRIRLRVLYIYGSFIFVAVLILLASGPALVIRRCVYTWSLLIWIVSDIAILWWLFTNRIYDHSKKQAFALTIVFLLVYGLILNVFFTHNLFTYPNKNAVIGIYLPGFSISEFRFVWEKPFPIEELFFYFFSVIFILLIYDSVD